MQCDKRSLMHKSMNSAASVCSVHEQVLSAQALRRHPDDEKLKADLNEVQACLQPANTKTLRAIADQRFRNQVCCKSCSMLINE